MRQTSLVLAVLAASCVASAQDVAYVRERSFTLPARTAPLTVHDPVDIAVGVDGAVHVLDGRGCVVVFSPKGVPRSVYGAPILQKPVALKISESGQIYVLDSKTKSVQVFGADGGHLGGFGRAGSRGGELGDPVDLTCAPGGLVYVLDAGRRAFEVFTRQGLFVREAACPDLLKNPTSIAAGPDGSMYLSDDEAEGLFYRVPAIETLPWSGPIPVRSVKGITIQGGAIEDIASIAVNDRGSVLLLDRARGRIWGRRTGESDGAGRQDLLYGGLGSSIGSFQRAEGLAFVSADTVVVLDSSLRKVEALRVMGETEEAKLPPSRLAIRVTYGQPPSFPGVLAALDCDSTGVARFFFGGGGSPVVSRRAKATPYVTCFGDSAMSFLPDIGAGEISYSQAAPEAGAVAVRGPLVVVSQPKKHNIVLLENGTGTVLAKVGDEYRDERRFGEPLGVAVDGQGRCIVADQRSGCVRVVSPDFASLVSIPFEHAAGVAVDVDGSISVWDDNGSMLSRVPPNGRQTRPVSRPPFPETVVGVCFDQAGNAFALDRATQQVVVIGQGGTEVLFTFGAERTYEEPVGVLVDPTGNVYIPDRKAGRTYVYRWTMALPAPQGIAVTYRHSGITVAWEPVASAYCSGYQVRVRGANGQWGPALRTDGTSMDIGIPADSGSIPAGVSVCTISASGATGAASPIAPVPGLGAISAFTRSDTATASSLAREALAQIGAGKQYVADSGGVASIGLLAMLDDADQELATASDIADRIRSALPPSMKPVLCRHMAELYLAASQPGWAGAEILWLANAADAPDALGREEFLGLTLRIVDAHLEAGDSAGASRFVSELANALVANPRLRTQYEETLRVAGTRARLGHGFELWQNLEYEKAILFFVVLLTDSEGTLSTEQRILSYEIIAAAHYAFGRRADAEREYRKIFVLNPGFDLSRHIEEVQRLYSIAVFNPQMTDFFLALAPRPGQGG